MVLVDHQDSFVHTLGNYLRQVTASVVSAFVLTFVTSVHTLGNFRQTGALVTTLRYGFSEAELDKIKPTVNKISKHNPRTGALGSDHPVCRT